MLLSPLGYSVGGYTFIAVQICFNSDPFANIYVHNFKMEMIPVLPFFQVQPSVNEKDGFISPLVFSSNRRFKFEEAPVGLCIQVASTPLTICQCARFLI